ncbi:hypothetical protein C0Q70_05032 [Pomacea canaliculata]|uniref:SH3 domain-containing protein n=1 Tax=Pomacea canaliculata TaxID=400727 RepID=A0A2T7PK53_POMCA|nr:hypothetical protein C0Q70_05032 [Pomacea canaliculata]
MADIVPECFVPDVTTTTESREDGGDSDKLYDVKGVLKKQANCLYDFEGDADNGELTFRAGDILTIIRQDIGDGWWEGKDSSGQQGLIPETYVEILSIPEPAFPPPPPPVPTSAPSAPSLPPAGGYSNGPHDGGGGRPGGGDSHLEPQASYEEWDEDWDSDDGDSTTGALSSSIGQDLQYQGGSGLSAPRREHKQLSPTGETSKYGTVRSSFNSHDLIVGRYEEDFVQERMKFLQMWINRMVRHPLISRSEVFLHFLTCTDDKKWKQGKRKAEKDEYQGFKFFLTLSPPPQEMDMRDVDARMEVFCKFVMGMTDNVKQVHSIILDYAKKQMGPFKREYTKIGTAFKQLAATFNMDTHEASRQLTAAIDHTGDAYNDIGVMFERQGTVGKAKECVKLKEESKLTDDELRKVMARASTISYGTLAEMNHFQAERTKDFKLMMQMYLQSQIKFYKNMTKKLEDALAHYETIEIPS